MHTEGLEVSINSQQGEQNSLYPVPGQLGTEVLAEFEVLQCVTERNVHCSEFTSVMDTEEQREF